MINQFYGVTLHRNSGHVSIYEATLTDHTVVAKKIKENHSVDSVVDIDEVLKNGYVLGVMSDTRGFVMYSQGSRAHRPDGVNTSLWGGNTSPFVGLFTDLDDAIKCLNYSDLTYWDERFLDSSIETIKQIAASESESNRIRLDSSVATTLSHDRLRSYLRDVRIR